MSTQYARARLAISGKAFRLLKGASYVDEGVHLPLPLPGSFHFHLRNWRNTRR